MDGWMDDDWRKQCVYPFPIGVLIYLLLVLVTHSHDARKMDR